MEAVGKSLALEFSIGLCLNCVDLCATEHFKCVKSVLSRSYSLVLFDELEICIQAEVLCEFQ